MIRFLRGRIRTNGSYLPWTRPAAVVLLLSGWFTGAIGADADVVAELNKAWQPAGQTDGGFDAARLMRLQAIVRQAGTTGQLRLIEAQLVEILRSEVPFSAKQDICRVLWQIASAASAPALQEMLGKPETVDIACYAIAGNPDPELGRAVREALRGRTGRVAVSLLNLLGQRHDLEAVDLITPLLAYKEPEVASAAAVALGKIGSLRAVTALDKFRRSVPQERRVMADAAYLRSIESLEPARAAALWRELVGAKEESALVRRGALLRLSEQAPPAALTWLLAAVREEEPALTPATGQALRSLPDKAVIDQVARNLPEFTAPGQIIVVEALGDSISTESLAALMHQPAVRLSALRVLGTRAEPQAATALLREALSPEKIDDRPEIFRLLKALPGEAATDVLMEALPSAPAPLLSDLVSVLAAREAKPLLPLILERARHGESSARVPAIRALRFAATASDHDALFELLTSSADPETSEAVEETIAEIFSRSESVQLHADWILERLESAQRPSDRQALLRLLARTGSSTALERVLKEARDGGGEDRDAAFRALTQWPNDAALEPLLEFAGQPLNDTQRALALRGALRLLRESQLPASAKTDRFRRLVPLASDAAGRKLLLSGLAEVHDAGAMGLIVPGLDDPAVRAEAAMAAIALAPHLGRDGDAAVNAAMNKLLAVVQDAGLRDQAQASIRLPCPPLPDVYLETLPPLKAVSGNDGGKGKPQLNRNCIGQPLKLKGVTYERGVGEHSPAELTYEIDPSYARFVCMVGLDDQVARYNDVRGSIVVKVFADDKLLVRTPVLRGGGALANVNTVLPAGAKALRLVVEDAGDGVDFDDADFVNAGFVNTDRSAAPAAQTQAVTDERGFTPLFDGRTFAGWEGNRQAFRIEEGAFVGGSLRGPVPRNEFLCTTNRYADFELRLKFKLLGNDANGGVQIRSRRVPGNEVAGYQADLGQTYWGNLYDESRRNKTLVQADQAEVKMVLKQGDWNDYRIRCQGKRIQLWINGLPTVDYTEPDDSLEQSGIIGLQIHGGSPSEAWYKDIMIKPLP